MITPISTNNTSFCGKRQIASILTAIEQKKIVEYRNKLNCLAAKPLNTGIKRAVDLAFSVVGLILTAPIILICGIAIKLDSKGPFLFKQTRIGKDGKPFTIYKLRTMITNAGDELLKTPHDKRVTKIGKILRRYSIDEFPQFINIIKGEMSLVGPRPININAHNLRKNDKDFFLRYSVKPGATLNYPSTKVDYTPNLRINTEKDYIENWSLKNDLKIVTAIILKIFKRGNY